MVIQWNKCHACFTFYLISYFTTKWATITYYCLWIWKWVNENASQIVKCKNSLESSLFKNRSTIWGFNTFYNWNENQINGNDHVGTNENVSAMIKELSDIMAIWFKKKCKTRITNTSANSIDFNLIIVSHYGRVSKCWIAPY